jgi:hypothetical protein
LGYVFIVPVHIPVRAAVEIVIDTIEDNLE